MPGVHPTVRVFPRDVRCRHSVPLGVSCTPLEDAVVLEDARIVRCKVCRTYCNAFVEQPTSSTWKCNICGYSNQLPPGFRPPEHGSVEYSATSEYMVRPPQAPAYVFVIDVSAEASARSVLSSVVAGIKSVLGSLLGQPRTMVGFVTYDRAVHFYSLKSTCRQPTMLCVPEVGELFLPVPDDLLANLAECRPAVDTLLDALPTMFAPGAGSDAPCSALGAALTAAYRVLGHTGGKVCVFQCSPPAPETKTHTREWYEAKGLEFSRMQICVEIFAFPTRCLQLDTLASIAKATAGRVYFYAAFDERTCGERFAADLTRCVSQQTALEAVLRIRCTRGIRMQDFQGHFTMRGNDLLALPNCSAESTFSATLSFEDEGTSLTTLTLQAALLYTSSSGHRRIRVHTLQLPTSTAISEVLASIDLNVLMHMEMRKSLAASHAFFPHMRRLVFDTYALFVRHNRHLGANIDAFPEALQFFPLHAIALAKNAAFRDQAQPKAARDPNGDAAAFHVLTLQTLQPAQMPQLLYPPLYALHSWQPGSAPVVLSLSRMSLEPTGVYVIVVLGEAHFHVGEQADRDRVAAFVDDRRRPTPLFWACTGLQEATLTTRLADSRFSEFLIEDAVGALPSYENFLASAVAAG